MHRVIIPVDFSETSLNAARFSARMLAGRRDTAAVLYHNYESPDDFDVSNNYLESIKKEFLAAGVDNVICEGYMGGDLIQNIAGLARDIRATMIVMGITGKSVIRQAIFGSNTLKLIDRNQYPVMIVPPDASYKGLEHVALATDLKNVADSTPAELISAVLEIFNPCLHLFHVSNQPEGTALTPEQEREKQTLLGLFSRFDIRFQILYRHDFYAAVDEFVRTQDIDVLLTIPKHQSNSMSIFKSTHTKRLAYHSHIPVLAAHE